MFQNIGNFVRRHKRKFLVLGGIAGGYFLFRKFLSTKLSEWESKQTQDFLDQMKRFHHFEGTLQTCDSTVQNLLPKVCDRVRNVLKVDDLIEQLKTNPDRKLQTWEELKILVFVEAISEICGEALFVSFLRVQLSVIGGYMYIDTQKFKLENCSTYTQTQTIACSADIQQKYLACIHNFFGRGLQDVFLLIRDSVQTALARVSLKSKLNLQDFKSILAEIKQSMFSESTGILSNVSSYLLPDEMLDLSIWASGSEVDPNASLYQKMLLETKDILDTPDFKRVVRNSLEQGLARFVDRLSECITYANKDRSIDDQQPLTVPLAKIIPVLHMQFQQQIAEASQGNSVFIQYLLQAEEARTFAANIYESFSQPFDVDHNIRGSVAK